MSCSSFLISPLEVLEGCSKISSPGWTTQKIIVLTPSLQSPFASGAPVCKPGKRTDAHHGTWCPSWKFFCSKIWRIYNIMREGCHSQCKGCSTSECELRQACNTSSVLLTTSLCSCVLPQHLIQLSVSLFISTKRKGTAGFMQIKAQLSGYSYIPTKTFNSK